MSTKKFCVFRFICFLYMLVIVTLQKSDNAEVNINKFFCEETPDIVLPKDLCINYSSNSFPVIKSWLFNGYNLIIFKNKNCNGNITTSSIIIVTEVHDYFCNIKFPFTVKGRNNKS